MIEAGLLGGILGGISRMVPEVMKFMDRKKEREHEVTMFDLQLKADAQKSTQQLAAIDAQSAGAQFTSSLSALQEAIKAQATQTGIKIVDAINALVRPGVTYIVFGMWVLVKLTTLYQLSEHSTDFSAAVLLWWTSEDQAMLTYILNFWFLGRVFEKALR